MRGVFRRIFGKPEVHPMFPAVRFMREYDPEWWAEHKTDSVSVACRAFCEKNGLEYDGAKGFGHIVEQIKARS